MLVLNAMAFGDGHFTLTGLSAEAAGLAIFAEADRRASGYRDLSVDLEMILRAPGGAESRRQLKLRQLEMAGGDRLLLVLDAPKPIRGTALLSHAHKLVPDDQWLYLPALKRVKKIASRNQSGPFLSSEFAYEDMALQELEKYRYRHMETRAHPDGERFVVERIPVDCIPAMRASSCNSMSRSSACSTSSTSTVTADRSSSSRWRTTSVTRTGSGNRGG